MTKQELADLKKALPRGSQKKMAESLGITLQAVGQTLSGKSKNGKVIELALIILAEEKKRSEKQSKLLSKLI
jgi:hypothetical protein